MAVIYFDIMIYQITFVLFYTYVYTIYNLNYLFVCYYLCTKKTIILEKSQNILKKHIYHIKLKIIILYYRKHYYFKSN